MFKIVKKTVALLLLIITVCCTFTACSNNEVAIRNSICVLSNYIPFYGSGDTRGAKTIIFEEDAYGRALCAYGSVNISYYMPAETIAVMVVQKIDTENQLIYYYEDCFYIFYKEKLATFEMDKIDISSAEIEALKVQNDWGKELKREKMSARTVHITSGFYIDKEFSDEAYEMRRKISKELEEEFKGKDCDLGFLDYDGAGLALHRLYVKNSDGSIERYFVLTDDDCNYTLKAIPDVYDCCEVLTSFKQENGWQFGYVSEWDP